VYWFSGSVVGGRGVVMAGGSAAAISIGVACLVPLFLFVVCGYGRTDPCGTGALKTKQVHRT